jgi:outer membrane protein
MIAPWLLPLLLASAPRVLTLQQALDTADVHQPDLRAELANVDVAWAKSGQASSALMPQVSAQGIREWTTLNSAGGLAPTTAGATGVVARPNGNPNQLHNVYSASVTASQVLFDFGQTFFSWRAARAQAQAEGHNAEAERLLIRLNVRTAYFNARAQKALVDVARQTLENEEKHLAQTKGFVEVGTQPEISLATEQTREANDRFALIQQENGYSTSKAQLNQAMGVEGSTEYDVEDAQPEPLAGEGKTVDDLMVEAVAARPEFAAYERQIRGQELTIDAARAAFFPSLGLQAGANERGTALDKQDLAFNYYFELVLTWNLFPGLTPYYANAGARAILRQLEAKRDSERLQVRLEVEQAWLAVRAATAEQQAAAEALENAQSQLHLAEGRYQTGVGSVIELGDAQVASTTAAAQRVKSDYDLDIARAQLLKALGRD